MRLPIVLLVLMVASAACSDDSTDGDAESVQVANGQGEIAGEVTEDSVILQSRLTTTGGFVDGDLPGRAGVGRFEVSTSSDFMESTLTDWLEADAPTDFIVKVLVDGLTQTLSISIGWSTDRTKRRPSSDRPARSGHLAGPVLPARPASSRLLE